MSRETIRRAARLLHRRIDSREPRRQRFDALLGDDQGTVAVPGFTQLVYARLLSDTSQRIRVRDTVGLSGEPAGRLIEVERLRLNDTDIGWVAVGFSLRVYYPQDPSDGPVPLHDHPRGNIKVRAIWPLRVQPQPIPNLTVHVNPGWFFIDTWRYYPGGDTAAFTAPTTVPRVDGVCVDSDGDLVIVAGAGAISYLGGFISTITVTGIPDDAELLGLVILVVGQTAIYETDIVDARAFVGRPTAAALLHNLLSLTHPDTVAATPVEGDLIVADATPAWTRFAKGTGTQLLKMVSGVVTWALSALSELSDVTISSPANGDVLTYDSGTSAWINAPAAGGTAHNLLDGSTDQDTLAGTVVLGDLIHGNGTPKWARLAGQTTSTRKFLRQTGTGTISAVPAWDTLAAGDLPTMVGDSGSGGVKGAVPAPAAGDAAASKFLKADGTWATAGGAGTPATTVTDETTFGISPAVGTATNYAREDHTHGSEPHDAHGSLTGVSANQHHNQLHNTEHQNGGGDEIATATPGANVIPKAGAGGKLAAGFVPDFVASGASHANGGVPDPGVTSGTTKFLREDGTWATPGGTGGTVVGADAIWDVKGDLAVASGADAASRLPVGTNGQILTADSTQTLGVTWASGGGADPALAIMNLLGWG